MATSSSAKPQLFIPTSPGSQRRYCPFNSSTAPLPVVHNVCHWPIGPTDARLSGRRGRKRGTEGWQRFAQVSSHLSDNHLSLGWKWVLNGIMVLLQVFYLQAVTWCSHDGPLWHMYQTLPHQLSEPSPPQSPKEVSQMGMVSASHLTECSCVILYRTLCCQYIESTELAGGLGMSLGSGLGMRLGVGLGMRLANGLGMSLAGGLGMSLGSGLGMRLGGLEMTIF